MGFLQKVCGGPKITRGPTMSSSNLLFLLLEPGMVVNMWAPRLIGGGWNGYASNSGAGHIRWEGTIAGPTSVHRYYHKGTATS